MPKIEYGIVNYDVPERSRRAYSKVSKIMRQTSIMQSWSCYLVPWGLSGEIQDAITEVNEHLAQNDLPTITFSILPFDSSANEQLLAQAERGLHNIVSQTKETLMKNLKEIREKFERDEDAIGYMKGFKAERKKAMKKLEDAQKVSTVFLLTDNMQAAFITLNKVIEAATALPAELTGETTEEESEEETETAS